MFPLLYHFFKSKPLTVCCCVSCLPLSLVMLKYTPCFPQISGDEFFADVAQDILLYVSRDLRDQVGCSLS